MWHYLETKAAIRYLLYPLDCGSSNVTKMYEDVKKQSLKPLGYSAHTKAVNYLGTVRSGEASGNRGNAPDLTFVACADLKGVRCMWRYLETKGAIRFLLYLLDHGPSNVTKIFEDAKNQNENMMGLGASYTAIKY